MPHHDERSRRKKLPFSSPSQLWINLRITGKKKAQKAVDNPLISSFRSAGHKIAQFPVFSAGFPHIDEGLSPRGEWVVNDPFSILYSSFSTPYPHYPQPLFFILDSTIFFLKFILSFQSKSKEKREGRKGCGGKRWGKEDVMRTNGAGKQKGQKKENTKKGEPRLAEKRPAKQTAQRPE